MPTKSHTAILFVTSLLTLTAVVGTLVFLISIIAHKNQHASSVLATLASKSNTQVIVERMTKRASEVATMKNKISAYFVDPMKLDALVDYFEKLGSSIGLDVSVTSVQVQDDIQKSNVAVTVTTTGSYKSVMQLIALIENAPYQVHIKQVTVEKRNKELEVVNQPIKKQVVAPASSVWTATVSFTMLHS